MSHLFWFFGSFLLLRVVDSWCHVICSRGACNWFELVSIEFWFCLLFWGVFFTGWISLAVVCNWWEIVFSSLGIFCVGTGFKSGVILVLLRLHTYTQCVLVLHLPCCKVCTWGRFFLLGQGGSCVCLGSSVQLAIWLTGQSLPFLVKVEF